MSKKKTEDHDLELAPESGYPPLEPQQREPIDHLPPPPPRPSIGRIVIYTSTGEKGAAGEQHGAFITAVDADTVCLRVFTRTSDYVKLDVRQADDVPGSEEAQGRWAWPLRV